MNNGLQTRSREPRSYVEEREGVGGLYSDQDNFHAILARTYIQWLGNFLSYYPREHSRSPQERYYLLPNEITKDESDLIA